MPRYTVIEVIADQRDALNVSAWVHVVDAETPQQAVIEAELYDEDAMDDYDEENMPPPLTIGAHWSKSHDRVILIGVAPSEVGTCLIGHESNG